MKHSKEIWYNIIMSYEDAIKKAEEKAKFFPCGKEEGDAIKIFNKGESCEEED